MDRFFLIAGSFFAFIAIASGAFGAHFLNKHLDAGLITVFETAVRYQMYHALALGLVSFAIKTPAGKWGLAAGWSFVFGIILFSGSLYVLSFTGIKWLGAITPLGGIAFLFGWFSLLMSALKRKDNHSIR